MQQNEKQTFSVAQNHLLYSSAEMKTNMYNLPEHLINQFDVKTKTH